MYTKKKTKMYNVFIEATDNIRIMHEIETILDNDDIPARSRSYFLSLLTISYGKKLTQKQQKNVKVFRELFVRIDKDTRMFRTFLNIAVDLATRYKFEKSPLVYAFKNLSIEDHFLNFVDFAKRRNPVIDRNNPLQLFLSLGISIIKLSIEKNQIDSKKKESDVNKKLLLSQYNELSREMSERFINMDFGDDLMANQSEFDDILNDSDDYENVPTKAIAQIHATSSEDDYENHNYSINRSNSNKQCDIIIEEDEENTNFIEECPPNRNIIKYKSLSKYDYMNENINDYDDDDDDEEISNNETLEGIENNIVKILDSDANTDVVEIMENIIDDDKDSGIIKDSENDDILKSLKNGDKELNLQNLDSLVMEAGRQFGPSVLGTFNKSNINNTDEKTPIVHFNSHNVKSIVDFIHPN
mgnify:CR=1 FL=1